MASIHFLNGVAFELSSNSTINPQEVLEANEKFKAIQSDSKLLGLSLRIVLNVDESTLSVMIGRNIAPSYQSIYQGRTICGEPAKYPLPPEFDELVNRLTKLIESKFEILFKDTGIILSQFA